MNNASPFVILTEASNASAGKDLGQLRASEAGTGSESLHPNECAHLRSDNRRRPLRDS